MKENFDDIIRRRWEEQQFPVDEAHRQAMERLLEGNKKKRGFLFWWMGGLALTMLMGYLVWIYRAPESPGPEKAKTEAKADDEFASANTVEPQGIETKAEETEAKEMGTSKPGTEKSNQVEFAKSAQATKKLNPGISIKQEKLNDHADATINPHDQAAKNESIPRPENTEKINTHNETPIDPSKEAGVEPGAGETPAEGYKVELDNPNQASILSNEASIRVFPDSIEYDPWTNAIYRDGTVRSLNMTKPLDALALSQVEYSKKITPQGIAPVTKMTHPVYLLAETGLGFVIASKPFYDGGIKFNIGGGLGMKLKPRVHMQLTGGYLMQDGGFDFERTSTVNSLSFGVRSQFNSLAPDRLHFVYGKLGAAYRFQRSTLDVHMGVQWLYGAQGRITIQSQSQVPPGNHEETNYTWLNTDGLRKTQWWSDVSYGYMLLPRLYLHGGVTFYYTSLTETNASLQQEGYYWNGKTAAVQPFITLNYLLHAKF